MSPISRGRLALAGAFALAFSSSLFVSPADAQMQPAAHPHVHGIASVDVAIDTASITVTMSSPLDNLIGFEHPPRTDGERTAAKAAVASLQQGEKVFAIDPAAGCTLKSVDLSSAALNVGHPDPSEAQAGHADIDGTYEFTCARPQLAKSIDVGLFRFAHMQKVTAQVAGPHGQFKRELTSAERRIVLSN
jgi:Protein of unknown function (DUF2796)